MVEINLLKNITVFQGLKSEEFTELAKICQVKEVEEGKEIFKAGEPRKEFFIVLEGKLRISRKIKNEKEKETLAFMTKDNFAVESALVNPKLKHTHFGDILQKGKILVIKGKDFLKLAEKNPSLANKIYGNIIANLTERLHHADNKLITLYSTGRIASTYANIYNILSLILEAILSVIKAKKALFVLFRPFENKAVIQEAIGYKNNQEIKNLDINLNKDPFLKRIFETGEDVFITQEEYKANKKWHLPYLENSALGVKVKAGKEILGAIILVDKQGENFSFNNQILLNIISRQVASAILEAEKLEEKMGHEELKRKYIKF